MEQSAIHDLTYSLLIYVLFRNDILVLNWEGNEES